MATVKGITVTGRPAGGYNHSRPVSVSKLPTKNPFMQAKLAERRMATGVRTPGYQRVSTAKTISDPIELLNRKII